MAPAYDLVRSRYAMTVAAGCFAAALLVVAVMVASTSAGIGGQLRPAATPAESRTVVDGPSGPALPLVREAAIPRLSSTASITATGQTTAVPPTAGGGSPTDPGSPTAPTTPVPVPAVPTAESVVAEVDDTVKTTVDELTALLEALPGGAVVGGLLGP